MGQHAVQSLRAISRDSICSLNRCLTQLSGKPLHNGIRQRTALGRRAAMSLLPTTVTTHAQSLLISVRTLHYRTPATPDTYNSAHRNRRFGRYRRAHVAPLRHGLDRWPPLQTVVVDVVRPFHARYLWGFLQHLVSHQHAHLFDLCLGGVDTPWLCPPSPISTRLTNAS